MKTNLFLVTITEQQGDTKATFRINYLVEARDVAHAFEKINDYHGCNNGWTMEVYISSFDYMKSETLNGIVVIA